MLVTTEDWQALMLTAKLAAATTGILLVVATPLAYWLARSQSRLRALVASLVSLPLVLPPTVLGFYLLMAMGPDGVLGRLAELLGLGSLAFSFSGLLIGSVLYSLPFVMQPLHAAMAGIEPEVLESAAVLGAGPLDRFFSIVLPLSSHGYRMAAMLGFAHTVGEFGVILMIGGNIPGETKVMSVQLYDHVEALRYGQAHGLAGLLVAFAMIVLLFINSGQRLGWSRAGSGR